MSQVQQLQEEEEEDEIVEGSRSHDVTVLLHLSCFLLYRIIVIVDLYIIYIVDVLQSPPTDPTRRISVQHTNSLVLMRIQLFVYQSQTCYNYSCCRQDLSCQL